MNSQLTDEEVVNYVKHYFKDYDCAAEVWDYGAKLRISIRGKQQRVIASVPSVQLTSVRLTKDIEVLCSGIALRISRQPPA